MTKKTKANVPALPPIDPLLMLAELAVKLEAMEAGEEKARFLNELAKSIPRDVTQEMEQRALAVVAREESVRGFAAYYRLVHGMEMPAHNLREVEGAFH